MKFLSIAFLGLFLSLSASAFTVNELLDMESAGFEDLQVIQSELVDESALDTNQVAQVYHVVNVQSQHCGGQNVVNYNQVVSHCNQQYVVKQNKNVKMTTVLTGGTYGQAVNFVKQNKVSGRVVFARRVSAAFQVRALPRAVVVCGGNNVVLNRVSLFGGLFSRTVISSVGGCFQ